MLLCCKFVLRKSAFIIKIAQVSKNADELLIWPSPLLKAIIFLQKKHVTVYHFVHLLSENQLKLPQPEYCLYMAHKIVESFTHKFLVPFRLVPKDGLTPEKLAFSVTLGIVSGIFPVIGMTTLLSILLTMLFRQNLLIVQAVQWVLALFQVLLIIPFMQLGAYILNVHAIHISMAQINHAFQPGMLSGIKTVGIFHLYGMLSWLILAFPAGAVSYFGFLFIFQRKSRKVARSIVVQN